MYICVVYIIGDAFDLNFGVILFRAKKNYSFVNEVLREAKIGNNYLYYIYIYIYI